MLREAVFLHRTTLQSASNRTVISVILGGKVTEITLQFDANCNAWQCDFALHLASNLIIY